MAKCSKLGSSSKMSVSTGARFPITTEFVRGGCGSIIIGNLLIRQVSGQRVRARRGFAQSTSGLWARSQSVPKIMSWSPNDVTYNSGCSS